MCSSHLERDGVEADALEGLDIFAQPGQALIQIPQTVFVQRGAGDGTHISVSFEFAELPCDLSAE